MKGHASCQVGSWCARIEPTVSDLKDHAFLDLVGGDKMTDKVPNEGSIGCIYLFTDHCNANI